MGVVWNRVEDFLIGWHVPLANGRYGRTSCRDRYGRRWMWEGICFIHKKIKSEKRKGNDL